MMISLVFSGIQNAFCLLMVIIFGIAIFRAAVAKADDRSQVFARNPVWSLVGLGIEAGRSKSNFSFISMICSWIDFNMKLLHWNISLFLFTLKITVLIVINFSLAFICLVKIKNDIKQSTNREVCSRCQKIERNWFCLNSE